jgi:outer membrane cobalamin receptor
MSMGIILFLLLGLAGVEAQVRSRISGVVKDASTGETLPGVNVVIEGTSLGAITTVKGEYVIINVPVGTVTVRASMMGYSAQKLTDVMVSADRVARADFALQQTVLEGSEVVVRAQRDELHLEVSNTQMVVNDAQLQDATGIREVNAFLTKLPGVSTDNGYLTIRGGSADQTGMLVNGLSYVNAAAGNAETSIPLSAIEQISLMSGGYNAEYGNFRSGLINVSTKSGSKSEYHGTLSLSRDNSHMRRFGGAFFDAASQPLRVYLDPAVCFTGTAEAWKDNTYLRQQYPTFTGWNTAAANFNKGKPVENQATPLDFYMLAAWMFMAIPDYEGLEAAGYDLSEITAGQRALFEEHHRQEDGSDWNIDGGFGGPVPLIGKYLGNATFYISNNSQSRHYVMPVVRETQQLYTTLATVRSQPLNNLTLTFNGLHKRQMGVSPIRPAFGDFPDASRSGGFMPLNNISNFKNSGDSYSYWFDPPFFPQIDQTTLMGGLTLNHVLSKSLFYEFSVSAMGIKNHSDKGDNRDQTILTQFGPFPVTEMPYGKFMYGTNKLVVDSTYTYTYPSYDGLPGVPYRFRRKEGDLYDNTRVGQYRAKFDIAWQADTRHYLKAGVEYNNIDIKHNLWQKWNENYYNAYEFNYHRTPSQTGVYLQDQITLESMIANLGLRYDYYYGGGGLWPTGDPFAIEAFTPQAFGEDSVLFDYLESGRSYIWDTWVAYDREHPGFLQKIRNHHSFSPRLGISFPVSDKSKFYFNYGHFRSNPPYYTMYLYRYRYTKNGLYDMSNPNLEPPRTISYELGVAYNFYDSFVAKISGYSKDVTGQHGEITYTNAAGSLDYDTWSNNEYQDIQGFEINLSKNDGGWLNGWINFNYMLKKSGLTGRELITDVTIGNDQEGLYKGQESSSLPVPKVNANLTLHSPDDFGPRLLGFRPLGDWSITLFGEWEAGDYFTFNPLSELHVSDNLRWPDYYMMDLKITRTFAIAGLQTTAFVDISNLFNFKVNYMSRGYPFDSVVNDQYYYLASLHLPMYDSAKYDALRTTYPGYFIPGNDRIGELRSEEKSYINDPNFSMWLYGQPRDIWFGLRFAF